VQLTAASVAGSSATKRSVFSTVNLVVSSGACGAGTVEQPESAASAQRAERRVVECLIVMGQPVPMG
jgi:hypothetical protein